LGDESNRPSEAARQVEEEKQRVETARQVEEKKQRVEAARLAAEELQRANVGPQPAAHREEDGPKIERFWEQHFLIWAREELRQKFGVSSSALSAAQAREQLERHGYRIWWSLFGGYKVQIPPVHNL